MAKKSFSELIKGDTPVLVDFYADWCQPCKQLSPIVEQLASEMGDQLKVIKVDIDNNQQAAQAYGIRGVPTLILFRNGQIQWRQSGVLDLQQLKQTVSQHIN